MLAVPCVGFGVLRVLQLDLASAHPRMWIYQSMTFGGALSGVRSEVVDFGPRQTGGERRIGPKYAIFGWTLARGCG